MAARKLKTRQSMEKCSQYGGLVCDAVFQNNGRAAIERSRPTHAGDDREEQTFHQELSDDAPAAGADRHAHGDLARASCDRDSSRFATLAHAMSSTNATAPIIDASNGLIGPPIPLRKIATLGPDPFVRDRILRRQAPRRRQRDRRPPDRSSRQASAARTREGHGHRDRSSPRRRAPRAAARRTSAAEREIPPA